PHLRPQGIVDPLLSAVATPEPKGVKDNPIRGQPVRQRSPGAALADQISDDVLDFPAAVLGWPTAGLGGGDQMHDPLLMTIREVAPI
ncbi:MAG: hypothetical protein N2039_12550, partial [Gemmataceae bacterium]|nr:hypothetical protein [Gemmataceae bacterium]